MTGEIEKCVGSTMAWCVTPSKKHGVSGDTVGHALLR